ncbi:unnamed protein product, partial [Umbelopsis sp. WA50703]
YFCQQTKTYDLKLWYDQSPLDKVVKAKQFTVLTGETRTSYLVVCIAGIVTVISFLPSLLTKAFPSAAFNKQVGSVISTPALFGLGQAFVVGAPNNKTSFLPYPQTNTDWETAMCAGDANCGVGPGMPNKTIVIHGDSNLTQASSYEGAYARVLGLNAEIGFGAPSQPQNFLSTEDMVSCFANNVTETTDRQMIQRAYNSTVFYGCQPITLAQLGTTVTYNYSGSLQTGFLKSSDFASGSRNRGFVSLNSSIYSFGLDMLNAPVSHPGLVSSNQAMISMYLKVTNGVFGSVENLVRGLGNSLIGSIARSSLEGTTEDDFNAGLSAVQYRYNTNGSIVMAFWSFYPDDTGVMVTFDYKISNVAWYEEQHTKPALIVNVVVLLDAFTELWGPEGDLAKTRTIAYANSADEVLRSQSNAGSGLLYTLVEYGNGSYTTLPYITYKTEVAVLATPSFIATLVTLTVIALALCATKFLLRVPHYDASLRELLVATCKANGENCYDLKNGPSTIAISQSNSLHHIVMTVNGNPIVNGLAMDDATTELTSLAQGGEQSKYNREHEFLRQESSDRTENASELHADAHIVAKVDKDSA